MVTVHEKENPIGVDVPIQEMQRLLKKKLNWNNVDIFGRVYKMKDGEIVLPHAYIGGGEHDKSVLTNEKGNNRVFFIVNGEEKELPGGQMEVEIKTVVITDLDQTFPDINHRPDNEARNHVHTIVKSSGQFRNVTKIESEYDKVMKGYEVSYALKLDVHPMHIFAIVSKVKYYLNSNC